MTKYILHGGCTNKKNELNRTYYEECTKELEDGSTVLFMYFASKEEDIPRKFEEDKGKILETTKVKNLNLVLATEDNFLSQLKEAHSIYIKGGNTTKLLDVLKKFPQFASELDGKIVAGSSAGAYIISTCYISSSKGSVHKGLGILPIRVSCHYQSEIHPVVDDQMAAIEECPNELELVVLKDFEWKVFEV
jgi:peptidase E